MFFLKLYPRKCGLVKNLKGYNSVVWCYLYFALSRYEMDKSDFTHFVNSVRWHCTILMKTTGLNKVIDRTVRGVCDIRPECVKMQVQIRNFIVASERKD